MKLVLYKIVLPFTVADYQRGFLYTLAYLSKRETGRGSGVEVQEQRIEPDFRLPDGTVPEECYFTRRVYHLERFVSSWARSFTIRMFGKNALKVVENCWDSYPYTYAVSWSMEKPDKVEMTTESNHFDNDHGRNEAPKYIISSENLKNKNSLKDIIIKDIDITQSVKGLKRIDPTKFRSEKAGIGPLPKSEENSAWHDKYDGPVMCVYKLVKARYDVIFGSTLENKFLTQQEFLMYRFHKQMYMLMDDWWDLSLKEVKDYEKEVASKLNENLYRDDVSLANGGFGHEDEAASSKRSSIQEKTEMKLAPTVTCEKLAETNSGSEPITEPPSVAKI